MEKSWKIILISRDFSENPGFMSSEYLFFIRFVFENCYQSFHFSTLKYFKYINLWRPLAPLMGEVDIRTQ